MKARLVTRDEVDIDWELMHGVPVFHMNLKTKWTPSIKRKFMAGIYEVRKMFGNEGYDHLYVMSPYNEDKVLKFHISLGFEPWAFLDDADGNHIFTVSRQPTIKV